MFVLYYFFLQVETVNGYLAAFEILDSLPLNIPSSRLAKSFLLLLIPSIVLFSLVVIHLFLVNIS